MKQKMDCWKRWSIGWTGLCSHPAAVALVGILIYFLVLDGILFCKVQSFAADGWTREDRGATDYDMFYPLPIKKIMMAPATHYIRSPLAEYFERISEFTSKFPWISGDMVSYSHCVLSVIAARFLVKESLFSRQIGVIIYQSRNFLDSLDGVVVRAHLKQRQSYRSNYGSYGYYVDAVSDVFGGTCLVVATLLHFMKKPAIKWTTKFPVKPVNDDETASKECLNSQAVPVPKKVIVIVFVLFGVRFALSAFFWDQSVRRYQALLDLQDSEHQLPYSSFSFVITWLWRWANAISLQDQLLTAIFFDKAWEYVTKTQCVGTFFLIVLVVCTEIHLAGLKSAINLPV